MYTVWNIDLIKDKYENPKTFANVKSLLKRFNMCWMNSDGSLGIKPYDYVHEYIYCSSNENFQTLYRQMITEGVAKNRTDALYKLNILLGILNRNPDTNNRTGMTQLLGYISNLKEAVKSKDKVLSEDIDTRKWWDIDEKQADTETIYPWNKMLELFDEEIKNNPNHFAKIACVCFKHGYCMSIRDIYMTTTRLGMPTAALNHLNLETRVWTVTEHRNAHFGRRVFPVTQEFVDEVRKYIELPGYLLMYKSTFEPYNTHLLSSIGISSFTNADVRNSYNYWNWTASGRTKKESTDCAINVMGYILTTANKYAKQYEQQEPPMLQGCDPHPLYLENPERYTVSGKIRILVKPRPKSPTAEPAK